MDLTLNNIRAEILCDAIRSKDLNDLQIAEITRYVFSRLFFDTIMKVLTMTIDYQEVYKIMKSESFAMATPLQHLN
ncbi:MAG: hypothetical protein KDK44_00940 [Chlamydiia bacterium]|nr:hypothetical protein [Aequorivita sp.]MCB1108206.1 hypothetical protein [Chlamydiia bacterium]